MDDEKSGVDQEDEECQKLKKSIGDYNLQVMDVGSKARWIYSCKDTTQREIEARTLFTKSTEFGLSLTCQILGLENVYLNSLPGQTKPFENAISYSRTDTQCVLYRDLKLVPFVCNSVYLDAMPLHQLQTQWTNEFHILRDVCFDDTDNQTVVKSVLKALRDFMNSSVDEKEQPELKLNDEFMYLLAKHGTPTVYHTLCIMLPDININQVIQKYSGSTMLHVSAMFGQMNMVEYLLQNGADVQMLTIGGFTAAHVAALKGHKKCCNYILAFMAHKGVEESKCFIGLTPTNIMDKFEDVCKHSKLPLLTHDDALYIANRKSEGDKATQVLQKKGELLKINLPNDLLQSATASVCENLYMQKYQRKMMKEIENICNKISDERIQGKLIPAGSLMEGHEMFEINEVNFIYEVSLNHELPGCSSVACQEVVKDGRTTVIIEAGAENELFSKNHLRAAFRNSIKTLIKNHKSVSSSLSLVPPFIATSPNGMSLFWILNTANTVKLLKTCIMPVLPAVYSCDSSVDKLPSGYCQYTVDKGDVQLQVTNDQEEWIYRTFSYETDIFSNLEESHRKAWLTCRLLNKLIERCWWSPGLGNRWNNVQHWHTRSVGVKTLPDHALKALFLQELAQASEWETSRQLFERVYSVFQRATQMDMRGKRVTKEHVNSFIPSHHFCANVPASVCGILDYLDELREAQIKQDKIPKVKFA